MFERFTDKARGLAEGAQLEAQAAGASSVRSEHVLAALLKCPLYLMACLREGDGHTVRFEPLAEQLALPRKSRDEVLTECASRYAQRLESMLAKAPYEWFNFFPFWDQAPRDVRSS